MVKLRKYQIEAIDTIHETFKSWFRQYIEMPTGSGKTITFLSYAHKYHKNILIIVPSKELLKQVYDSCLLFYHHSQISRKGAGFDEGIAEVHICIINSIRGDYLEFLAQRPFGLIIIDEAHHTQADSYKRFIKKREKLYHEKHLKILGVTATPNRSDGLLLNELLHICSYKIFIQDLIRDKYLSDIEGFSVKTNIDISDIHNHNGDFSLNQLYKRLCTHSRNQMILDLVKQEMKDRKTLIFCINIQHSKEINTLLNKNGISSLHIDGKMHDKERNRILSTFRTGDVDVLCNCQLLTEGFDEPSIDGILLARPTSSRSLYLQMIGRGLRIFKGKENCKIIDIVDNHKKLQGFNSLVNESFESYPEMNSFKSISDISKHVVEEKLKITEFCIERTNLLTYSPIYDEYCTNSQKDYLKNNNIYFQEPISLDEASFLIWYDKLNRVYDGKYSKKN